MSLKDHDLAITAASAAQTGAPGMTPAKHGLHYRRAWRCAPKQKGAAELVQLIIATFVGILLAVGGVVYIPGILIENAVPDIAGEMQRFIGRARTMSQGGGAAPYTDVTTAQFANAMRAMRSTNFTVTGAGAAATVTHSIGAPGAAVTLTSGTLENAGDSMQITFNDVALAGCMPMAQVMANDSARITINGTMVKNTVGGVPGRLSIPNTETACTEGDTNDMVFLAR